ncbi:MAG: hypothetical protein ACK4UO_06870 [Pseudolabrys sp.]
MTFSAAAIWHRMQGGNLAAPLFCVVAVVVNHAAFRLGALPAVWTGLFVLAVAACAVAAPQVRLGSGRTRLAWPSVVAGLVVLAPLSINLALSWNRDFPFSGDHYFHAGQAYRMAFWWMSPLGSEAVRTPTLDDVRALLRHPASLLLSRAVVLAVVAAATVALYRWRRLVALAFLAAAVVGIGLCEQSILLRYPAGGYAAALPFAGPAFLLGNFELAGRAANVAAPVLWLFALRPWLIGRWPDLRILPAALLLYWHGEIIHYVNSTSLESWGLVFALLAAELIIARGARAAPLACLLIGAAATVKEPFILALPFVWLAGAPWRRPLREAATLTGAAIAAGFPFVLYYAARVNLDAMSIEASRGVAFGLPAHLDRYAREVLHRLDVSFPGPAGIAAVLGLVLIAAALYLYPRRRLPVACLSVTAVVILLLFVLDRNSSGWVGYFRFIVLAMPFLAAGAIALGYGASPPVGMAALGAALVLQAPAALLAIERAAGPVTRLNFIEAYDAPIFFPMKNLLGRAKREGLLPAGATVYSNAPDTSLRAIPGIPVIYAPPGQPVCGCSKEHPAVMSLYVRFTNLAAPFADRPPASGEYGPPRDRDQLWRAGREDRPGCLARMQQTCRHVLRHEEDGELLAILGVL